VVSPLVGSTGVSVDAPSGVIFSIRGAQHSTDAAATAVLQTGTEQLAAGLVVFGPATILALTIGDGTDAYVVDDTTECFRRIGRAIRTPEGTREYSIDASNARHWPPHMRSYVDDLTAGRDGLRQVDFTMTWCGSLVADAYRVLMRGGVFLSPGDTRPSQSRGTLLLVHEAHPIAMLIEQAGGAATDGHRRILSTEPAHLRACTPLVFGSAEKVARITRYHAASPYDAERAPLFAHRGLFRS
jgi:fructose-1,6-bisphosphatase I